MTTATTTATEAKAPDAQQRSAATISSRYELGSDPLLEERIKDGSVVIASLNVFQRWGNHLMFARNAMFPCDVVVSGMEAVGPGQHGDVVAIELTGDVPRPAPDHAPGTDSEPEQTQAMPHTLPDGRTIVAAVVGERPKTVDLARLSPVERLSELLHAPTDYKHTWPDGAQKHGRVVKVLQRDMDAYVVARVADGVLRPGQFIQSNYQYRFRPYNPLLPQVSVRGGDIPEPLHRNLAETLLLLRLQATPSGELVLFTGDIVCATYVDSLGTADSSEANTMAICTSYDIPSEAFADDVEMCVPASFPIPSKAEMEQTGRRDLRDEEFVCTIDPATARDLDDALSIRRSANGGYHVGVHIADVSFFVKPDTPIDEEARRRSTSTYFVDRVIPMLPRKLSEDYCSLNPGEEKFAFSCLFELDRDCHVVSEWFGQSVIRSRCRMAYEEAQQIIDDKDVDLGVEQESRISGESPTALVAKVRSSVTLLYEVARKMREESLTRGRVTIPNQKLGFVFDDMNSKLAPRGFVVVKQIFANWVVEEFMLLANTRTAQKIVQFLPNSALLRHHPPPQPQKIQKLKVGAAAAGIEVFGSSANDLQRTIDAARGNTHFAALCVLMKYSLSAAEYMANDVESTVPRSHFALGLDWYTHFTSPIRRYSDIIAHRQLLLAVEIEQRLLASGVALPTAADAQLAPKPGAHAFDASDAIDPNTLAARDYFYTYSEVDGISENANLRKENARKAGEESVQLFFCLYLRAVIKKSAVDRNFPAHPCAKMVVIQLKPGALTLFAEAIATEIVVGLRDTKQLFQLITPTEEESTTENTKTSAGAGKAVADVDSKRDAKAESKRRSKGGKANMVQPEKGHKSESTVEKDRPLTVQLDWGVNPETKEACIEEIVLFSEVAAELVTTTAQGPMKLGALIIPPWLRERAVRAQGNIPTSLQ